MRMGGAGGVVAKVISCSCRGAINNGENALTQMLARAGALCVGGSKVRIKVT